MEELLKQMEEVLEESVNLEDVLEDFEEWDSFAIITLVAFINKTYNVHLYSKDIRGAETVGDLINIVKEKVAS